jgi:hypothetical protein
MKQKIGMYNDDLSCTPLLFSFREGMTVVSRKVEYFRVKGFIWKLSNKFQKRLYENSGILSSLF